MVSRLFKFLTLVSLGLSTSVLAQTAVLPVDIITSFKNYNGGSLDSLSIVAANLPGLPATKAINLKRGSDSPLTYRAVLAWDTTAAIKKGDLLVATYYARRLSSPASLHLRVELTFQLNSDPYTQSLQANMPVDGTQWRKYVVPFVSKQDFAPGAASLQFRYGQQKQEFEVAAVDVKNYGAFGGALPVDVKKSASFYYPGRDDPQAPWRLQAQRNIEQYRKGQMQLKVVDAQGAPVTGATVQLNQLKSQFRWASAVSANLLVCSPTAASGKRACNNINNELPLTADDQQRYKTILASQFNASSFYNDLKWPEWESDAPLAIAGLDWMVGQGLDTWRSHNLIWPAYAPDYLMPADIRAGTPAATVKARIDGHFRDQLGALRGRIAEWDVVNEPYDNNDIQGRIKLPGVEGDDGKAITGKLPVTALADWFALARKIDPAAKLFLNEYSIFDSYNPVKAATTLETIKLINANGGKVDGLGLQGHFGQGAPIFTDMAKTVTDFDPVVSTFAVTEYDSTSLDPQFQADVMRDMMLFTFGSPKFSGLQMWGFWDGDHWLDSAPLYTKDWKLKPSGEVWKSLREKWLTRAQLTSGSSGVANVSAYYGRYRITVLGNGKSCTFIKDFNAPATLSLPLTC
jgi:GH35 family endo-1,4-beta-xylanase